ncbi:hypothetical protein BZA05DRAFT_416226 [Tricharina praecox]|uniref:uncharacterized protein n=1 Tax=Tricharina praecox TaxID=43433 RepID=UPI00221EEDD2|nr:uncharacterized protein BZA05DRAFT_416226 [Tricharina praecox]KAI5856571.1 hypothetical protein BZA05DRAFT_416226 [Tricharina praecox]
MSSPYPLHDMPMPPEAFNGGPSRIRIQRSATNIAPPIRPHNYQQPYQLPEEAHWYHEPPRRQLQSANEAISRVLSGQDGHPQIYEGNDLFGDANANRLRSISAPSPPLTRPSMIAARQLFIEGYSPRRMQRSSTSSTARICLPPPPPPPIPPETVPFDYPIVANANPHDADCALPVDEYHNALAAAKAEIANILVPRGALKRAQTLSNLGPPVKSLDRRNRHRAGTAYSYGRARRQAVLFGDPTDPAIQGLRKIDFGDEPEVPRRPPSPVFPHEDCVYSYTTNFQGLYGELGTKFRNRPMGCWSMTTQPRSDYLHTCLHFNDMLMPEKRPAHTKAPRKAPMPRIYPSFFPPRKTLEERFTFTLGVDEWEAEQGRLAAEKAKKITIGRGIKKVKKIFEALTRSNEPELERDD